MTDPDLRVASSAPRTVRRLFFALWPDDALLDLLVAVVHRYAGAVHGRPQRRDQLHVTLEFLGGVEDGRVGEVIAAGRFAAGCSGPSDIVFDRLEYWKRPQVLCMTAGVLPEPLSALVDGLRDALQSRGFEPEQRPFKAHLTLA
jgi:2'-5' RNA ligase